MNPTEVVRAVLAAAPDALYVASLGTPTSALRAASDDWPHLYLGGSMGVAVAVALGVAEKRPERAVVALAGDGEVLMGAGSLWSLAGRAPENLLVVVLADGHYSPPGDPAGRRAGGRPLLNRRGAAARSPRRVRRRGGGARAADGDGEHRRRD